MLLTIAPHLADAAVHQTVPSDSFQCERAFANANATRSVISKELLIRIPAIEMASTPIFVRLAREPYEFLFCCLLYPKATPGRRLLTPLPSSNLADVAKMVV
jgi:hypothetical protein